MFYYILSEYKESIYNSNNTRKLSELTVGEKLTLLTLILSAIGFSVFMILNIVWGYITSLLILIGIMAYIIISSNKRFKKNNIDYMEQYKKNKIEKLETLLIDRDLNSLKAIEWLINMCNQKLEEEKTLGFYINPMKTFMGSIIYPIIVAVAALVIKDMDSVDVIRLAILAIGILLELLALGYMILPAIEEIINKDRNIMIRFRDDLSYMNIYK